MRGEARLLKRQGGYTHRSRKTREGCGKGWGGGGVEARLRTVQCGGGVRAASSAAGKKHGCSKKDERHTGGRMRGRECQRMRPEDKGLRAG